MGLSAGMLLGSLQNNGTTAPAAGDFHGHACAGIKLGQIARLGYELDAGLQFSTDSTSVLNVTHTASISQIFNTPLFINAKRESDWTYGSTGSQNNGITANFLSAGATF